MRRPTLLENLIANLAGEVPTWSDLYVPPDIAYGHLKAMTGQDLGLDAERWKQWFDALSPEGDGESENALDES